MITAITNVQTYNTPDEMVEFNLSKNLSVYDIITLHKKTEAIFKFGERSSSSSKLGMAAHGAILSDENFEQKFLRDFDKDDHHETLTSDGAVKTWVKQQGRTGYSKMSGRELWEFAAETGNHPPILGLEKLVKEAEAEAGNMVLVSGKEYDEVILMRDTLKGIDFFNEIVENSTLGYGITCDVKIEGYTDPISVKVKCDMITKNYYEGKPAESNSDQCHPGTPSGYAVPDYKTGSDVSAKEFGIQCVRAHEYLKQSFITDVMSMVHDEDFKPGILVQMNKAPYIPVLYWLNNAQVNDGREQYMAALSKYAESCIDDVWPAQGEYEQELETPKWYSKAD